jgi:hypothetical protein
MQDRRFYFDYPSYDTRPDHTLGASFGHGTRSISTFTVLVPSTEAGGVNRGHSTSVRLTEILLNDAALCGTMTASACNLPLTRVVNKGEIRSSNVREEETDHPHCITLAGGSALMCRVVSCLVVDMIGVLTEPIAALNRAKTIGARPRQQAPHWPSGWLVEDAQPNPVP